MGLVWLTSHCCAGGVDLAWLGRRVGVGAAPSLAIHQLTAPARSQLPGRLHYHLLPVCRPLRQHSAFTSNDARTDALRRDQCRVGAFASRDLLDDHDDLECYDPEATGRCALAD